MNKQFLKGISEEEKEEIKTRLKANLDLFEHLSKLIDNKISEARAKQISNTNYELPAWSENQADLNGYQRALEDVKNLIKIG